MWQFLIKLACYLYPKIAANTKCVSTEGKKTKSCMTIDEKQTNMHISLINASVIHFLLCHDGKVYIALQELSVLYRADVVGIFVFVGVNTI